MRMLITIICFRRHASENGHAEIVKLLIESKADINMKDKFKRTALMFAKSKGYNDIVKLLTQAGAETEQNNSSIF